MFPFCPHCGRHLDQPQTPGQMTVCAHCKQNVGVVPVAQKPVVVDQADELIRSGTAARCPLCQQLVEVRTNPAGRSFAPHLAPHRKMCANGGKPLPAEKPAAAPALERPPQAPPLKVGPNQKDLSAHMTRDLVRVVSCEKGSEPQVEELTLEYLDKSDRVRLQIESLREILGTDFRMKAYPLNRPELAIWGNASACIVARKHPQGGYQQLGQAEILQVVQDIRQDAARFFQ